MSPRRLKIAHDHAALHAFVAAPHGFLVAIIRRSKRELARASALFLLVEGLRLSVALRYVPDCRPLGLSACVLAAHSLAFVAHLMSPAVECVTGTRWYFTVHFKHVVLVLNQAGVTNQDLQPEISVLWVPDCAPVIAIRQEHGSFVRLPVRLFTMRP